MKTQVSVDSADAVSQCLSRFLHSCETVQCASQRMEHDSNTQWLVRGDPSSSSPFSSATRLEDESGAVEGRPKLHCRFWGKSSQLREQRWRRPSRWAKELRDLEVLRAEASEQPRQCPDSTCPGMELETNEEISKLRAQVEIQMERQSVHHKSVAIARRSQCHNPL